MNLIKYIYIVPVNTINNFREGVRECCSMQSQQFSLQDNLYYNEMKMMMMSTLYTTNMFSLIFIML